MYTAAEGTIAPAKHLNCTRHAIKEINEWGLKQGTPLNSWCFMNFLSKYNFPSFIIKEYNFSILFFQISSTTSSFFMIRTNIPQSPKS